MQQRLLLRRVATKHSSKTIFIAEIYSRQMISTFFLHSVQYDKESGLINVTTYLNQPFVKNYLKSVVNNLKAEERVQCF